MNTYVIEKIISTNNTMNDVNTLSELISNSESVHKILGELFNVADCNDWRSKNNILYRKVMNSTCKFIVQSDVEIDMTKAKKLGFSVQNTHSHNVKNGETVSFKLAVSPFKTDGKNRKRLAIKTPDEREAWLRNKLTHNGECNVLEITELNEILNPMSHAEAVKGSGTLFGRDYFVVARIDDADAFNKLRRKGIGPCKNYGFGLIAVTE